MERALPAGQGSITVAVPHRISGFFEIVDQAGEDLEKVGSRGGGPCLSLSGLTRVKIDPEGPAGLSIKINGLEKSSEAKTSLSVLEQFPPRLLDGISLSVAHDFPLPTGSGYGSSGCGAIGLAVAMNVLHGLGLSLNDCGRIAHRAEVENRTGLGTVGGQIRGGCTITTAPGYPFSLQSVIVPPEYKVACASKGSLLTSSILRDQEMRAGIISAGKVAMASMLQRFTIENFMAVSEKFVRETGLLLVPELDLGGVSNIMDEINDKKKKMPGLLGASMNQLGRSIYCIYKRAGPAEEAIADTFTANGFDSCFFLDFDQGGPQVVSFQ